MKMGVLWRGLCVALVGGLFQPAITSAQAPVTDSKLLRRMPPPRPLIWLPPRAEAVHPVRLDTVKLRAKVVGTEAHTVLDLRLYNPNDRVLEAELQFPLHDDQTVTGFALDINGRLRSAVAVPKATGRKVFEDITRTQVDPALLQHTQGNHHSLRVYPIPARGHRDVRLELTQSVIAGEAGRGSRRYTFPLWFSETVGQLELDLDVQDVRSVRQARAHLGAQPLHLTQRAPAGLQVRHQGKQVAGGRVLELSWAGDDAAPSLSIEQHPTGTYAHGEVPVTWQRSTTDWPAAKRLSLIWDASGSARQRDMEREHALLDAYFQQARDVEVELQVVRDRIEPPQRFQVRAGDWSSLRQQLQAQVLDGATHLGLSQLGWPEADLRLVFSDGLGNHASRAAPTDPRVDAVRTVVVVSSPNRDLVALTRSPSGPLESIDLQRHRPEVAVKQLTQRQWPQVTVRSQGVDDLVSMLPAADGDRVRWAGKLRDPSAVVSLVLTEADGRSREVRVPVQARVQSDKGPQFAAKRWAEMKAQSLQTQPGSHRAEIERLGKVFNLLTPETSLIVLETPQDYARHSVTPPADEPELVQAVERMVAQRGLDRRRDEAEQLRRVSKQFEAQVAWWETEHPKGTPPPPKNKTVGRPVAMPSGVAGSARELRRPALDAASPAMAERMDRLMAPAPAPAATGVPSSANSSRARQAAGGNGTPPEATIRLRKWQPDSRYAQRMRAASADEVYAIYLDERAGHENSTAFFLDAADILRDKGQAILAARVLSNLAEMRLEDRSVLRILAYRLSQLGDHALAKPLFERVLELAPDEPQSWRDLALSHMALGEHQAAVDRLWHVVRTPWHNRFPDIEQIALGELNATVARAAHMGKPVDTSAIPSQLLRHLPVGLRVVMSWDADNTDVDLWVIDPNAEATYYGARQSHQGGVVSRDFTGGYGPEEFKLRDPKAGTYKVQANFYGHTQQVLAPATTVMVQVFTDFGLPTQTVQHLTLRVSGQARQVDVGEVVVGESR